jgi:hypothetical protein
MKNWFKKNYKTIITLSFLIPIITVAVVSITHVTKWYGISNPLTWAIYLSIGIEIAALSALAAISANMGSKVYFPFGIVTLIQFIGNIYFAYSYIDISGQSFISWVELVSPLLEYMGVEPTDYVSHKRFLSFFAGGMLPVISLTFLHMLVKFTQEEKKIAIEDEDTIENKIPQTVTPERNEETPVVDAKDIIGEVSRVRLTEDDLNVLEKILNKIDKPSETNVNSIKLPEKEELIKKWDELGLIRGDLKPMEQESNLIDLLKPNEPQTINEPEEGVISVSEEPEIIQPDVEVSEPIIVDPVVPYEEPSIDEESTPIIEEPIIEESEVLIPSLESKQEEETPPLLGEFTSQVEETPITELPLITEEEKKK